MEKDNLILTLTLDFAVAVIGYTEELEGKRKFVIANQLLKSGTSIGANVREAQNAESKADFIHKFKIAAKEIEETDYWLLLCQRASSYPDPTHLQEKLKSIKRIISKIIISSKSIK
ncbi:four helix bundle protein [Pontibacter sp. JH31]|uniref:Four helix bundle protein n=1 Tax=Pontibacter aquaedesilientis TaxID=2766980 RepID=A0ABR7XH35_9BACT|nr:four helix bundle protein [Pontibacter aquaedesilientis]MBD1397602.1 four helix bundle protein [Pontibacter aquaedesilientis]